MTSDVTTMGLLYLNSDNDIKLCIIMLLNFRRMTNQGPVAEEYT